MVTLSDWDHCLGFVREKLADGEITHAQFDEILRLAVKAAPATEGTQSDAEVIARLRPTRHVLARLFEERTGERQK